MESITAYSSVSRESLLDRGVNWQELAEYIQAVGPVVEGIAEEQGIAERPPQIRYDEEFDPRGWVGTYPGGLEVRPDKIDRETYDALLQGAAGLVESFGIHTATAGLPFSPDTLDDARTQYLSYSRQLIRLTETLLDDRLPVVAQREKHVGYDTVGAVNVQRTLREQAQQTGQIASTKTTFTIDAPVIRLLYRFHADLQRRLLGLRCEYGITDPKLGQQAKYHQRVRRIDLPGAAPDRETGVSSDEIATLRESYEDPVRDLANLWTAFRRRQAMEVNWQDRFESAIKPISAVYELWCLTVILDIIEDCYGDYQPNDLRRIPSVYEFESAGLTLYYDRSVAGCSTYVTEHYKPQLNARAGNPDFLLTQKTDGHGGGEVTRWVADAKFQRADDLDTSGVLRFLAYLVDYLKPGGGRGTLLCIGGDPANPKETVEGRESRIRAVGPNSLDVVSDHLRRDITRSIKSI